MIDVQTTGKTRAEETGRPERLQDAVYYLPQCDIVEEKDQLLVLADLPGAKGEDIDIKFEDGELTIHAKVAPRQGPERAYILEEYGVGDYYRTFMVGESIDANKIAADYADGVLTLHLPKAEALKPRKISVNTANGE